MHYYYTSSSSGGGGGGGGTTTTTTTTAAAAAATATATATATAATAAATKHGCLLINPKKTKVMIFQKRSKTSVDINFKIDTKPVEIVQEGTY